MTVDTALALLATPVLLVGVWLIYRACEFLIEELKRND